MNRRNVLQFFAASALFSLIAPWASAQVAGKDYIAVSPPQPGGSNGQIEVIEFFSFACPHCNEFDPFLSKWRAAQPKDVVFRRVPVSFGRPDWAALARMYLTLNALGLSEKMDPLIFEAIHKNHVNLMDEKIRTEWLAKEGVDLKKYADTSRSFSVESMVKRSDQLSEAYKVQGVPSLAVDGRYMMQNAPTHEQLLTNTGLVIAKVRTDKAKK